MTPQQDAEAEELRTLRLLIDASNDGFWDWNIVTGAVRFGGRWGEMLGYPPETLEPHVRTWERLVHPDDRPWVMATLQAHLDAKTEHYQAEHRLLAHDGSWRWILDRGRVVERDAHGRPLRACGAHVDVTASPLARIDPPLLGRNDPRAHRSPGRVSGPGVPPDSGRRPASAPALTGRSGASRRTLRPWQSVQNVDAAASAVSGTGRV